MEAQNHVAPDASSEVARSAITPSATEDSAAALLAPVRASSLRSRRGGDEGVRPYTFRLVFFVLVRLVHREPAKFIGDFQQALIAVVPFRAQFAKEHRSLIRPA